MQLSAEITGLKEFDGRLRIAANKFADMRPLLDKLEREFYRIEIRQFATLGGGKWAPLSAAYEEEKAKDFPGMPIMVRTGDLRDSLTRLGGRYQVRRVTEDSLVIGTNAPGASAHQASKRKRLPIRRLIDLQPEDMRGFKRIAGEHLRESVKDAGLR
jgi:phage gpG-like protein